MEQTIGQKMKAIREAREWSGARLARALGVTRQLVCLYESGRQTPGRSYQRRFAAHLGIAVESFNPDLGHDLHFTTADAIQLQQWCPGAWVPLGPGDAARAESLGLHQPGPLAELLRRAAENRIAVVFRGDLLPLPNSEEKTQ